jgi:hypothetical protein
MNDEYECEKEAALRRRCARGYHNAYDRQDHEGGPCSSGAAVRALRENPPPRLQPRADRCRVFKSFEDYLHRTYPSRRK